MALAVTLSLLLLAPAAPGEAQGVVVEEVQAGFSAHAAGLKPGDVLLRWERAASPPANTDPANGDLRSTFDLGWVEREQAPHGALTFHGIREGGPLVVRVPVGEWRLETRPPFGQADLAAYEEGKALTMGGDRGQGLRVWDQLRARLRAAGDRAAAAWLALRAGTVTVEERHWEQADQAFADALADAEALHDARTVAQVHDARGHTFHRHNEWERAIAAFRAAIEGYRAVGTPSFAEAGVHHELGRIDATRGDLAQADGHHRRALAIRERLAPRSSDVGLSLRWLGIVAYRQGNFDRAEDHQRRALAVYEELGDEVGMARILHNLGLITASRGDLAGAEEYYRRVRVLEEPVRADTSEFAVTLQNLGLVASKRGDLTGAEAYYRRALAIQEQARRPLEAADNLHNLALVFLRRGELEAAADHSHRAIAIRQRLAPYSPIMGSYLTLRGMVEAARGNRAAAVAHLRRALAVKEKAAPESLDVAYTLNELAALALKGGDLAVAREHLQRALAIEQRRGPEGGEAAVTHDLLGQVAAAADDAASADSHYLRALEIQRRMAPRTYHEAAVCHHRAALRRRQGQLEQAVTDYFCALDALEAQHRTVGGTDEVKASAAGRYANYYREAVDLLVEMGRTEEAFHVLERYRARGLLALLAERDLVFSADIPAEMDQQRRTTNAEYDRMLAQLGRSTGSDADKVREALAGLRRRQAALQERIRAASPRLASLQYPQPLGLSAVRSALDPGTLLLSYSVGETRSHLFAVGPGPADFRVAVLGVGRDSLRSQVALFRRHVGRPGVLGRTQLHRLSGELSRALLRPANDRIARAERLLILPDGPLHLLPFAALADPTSMRRRHLIEVGPVHVAASATVFAELKERRRPQRSQRLIAFGDPDYGAVTRRPQQSRSPELRHAGERGLDLRPLPGARDEVERIRDLYAGAAQVYLGSEATEERVKAIRADGSLVHFACHGLADEGSPLDSSLALTLPGDVTGRDNGLLQAWEIFEQVRMGADLVTLSACSTALGKEMSGEGILGLTRAFQYAGARSVLASLWKVSDASTSGLMTRFYAHLKRGSRNDAALRAAQLEMIRRPSSAHPFHWAAFQLVGDGY